MPDGITELLIAEKGKKYAENGEMIATYHRSLVFLRECPGVQLGQHIRVLLYQQGVDRAERPIYRAVPAPDDIVVVWREQGDGQVSHLKIARDWLLQEQVQEVLEIRALATRDGRVQVRKAREAFFDPASMTDSYIEESRTRVVTRESEYVSSDGSLAWKEGATQEEEAGEDLYPIETIQGRDQEWERHHRDPRYGDTQPVVLAVVFSAQGNRETLRVETTWGALPGWLHQHLLASYPLCGCGRKRLDTQYAGDGYRKCELCRAEEACERCGRKAKGVSLQNGQLLCDACLPYQEIEALLQQLPPGRLEAIAEGAQNLLAGTALPQEIGEALLRTTQAHISSQVVRDRLLRTWEGYRWYYFCANGVFGTKFSREALELLYCLPQARGNSLVELLAWLSVLSKPGTDDYFIRTQITHEEMGVPLRQVRETLRRVADSRYSLADRIRASEADRIVAVTAYRKAEGELPPEVLEEARTALQGEEQDYKNVVVLLKTAYDAYARLQRLVVLQEQEYTHCPVCGEAVEWPHVCSEQDVLSARGDGQSFTLKVSLSGETELLKLVANYDRSYREYSLCLVRADLSVMIQQVSVETVLYWHQPSRLEQELVEKIRQRTFQIAAIANERSRDGRIELVFERGANPRGEPQLQCEIWFDGLIRDDRAERGYRKFEGLILFSARANGEALPGERWICTPGRQIGLVRGRPIVVANLQLKANEHEIQEELSALEEELETERKRQARLHVDQAFDEEGQANTVLAEKLRKAGLI